MKFKIGFLAVVAVTGIAESAFAEPPQLFVDYGAGELSPAVGLSEKDLARVSHWAIRLYRTGEPTSTRDNWGTIVGPTRDAVIDELMAYRYFEKMSARTLGEDDRYTYDNIIGPIAVMALAELPTPEVLDAAKKVAAHHAEIALLFTVWRTMKGALLVNRQHGASLAKTRQVLTEYTQEVGKSIRQMVVINHQIEELLVYTEAQNNTTSHADRSSPLLRF